MAKGIKKLWLASGLMMSALVMSEIYPLISATLAIGAGLVWCWGVSIVLSENNNE